MLDIPFQYIIHSREHQQAVARLIRGLGNWFTQNGLQYDWEALPQLKLDEASTSPVPDVVICCGESPVAFIEITGSRAFKQEFKKAAELIEQYELTEGFTFDYGKNRWRKYQRGFGEVLENPSFCNAIGYDLNEFVN